MKWGVLFPLTDGERDAKRKREGPKVRGVPRNAGFQPQGKDQEPLSQQYSPESPGLAQAVKHALGRIQALPHHI